MDHGTSLGKLGRGVCTKENVLLGRAGSKLDRKGVWGTEVYVGYLKAGSLQGDSERDPASNFPLPFPELVVQGLEECPWSVGPVLSVIHLSVPTFK